jgi:hypothetical protein
VLTVGFTLLFTALSALCAAYVVKAVQFYQAQQAERRKLRTPETGRRSPPTAQHADDAPEELLELELLVRVTSSRPWWVAFQVTYILSMIMMAVSSIHVVVRAMDDLTILVFRNTFGLQVSPLSKLGLVLSCPAHDACKGVEAFYTVDTEGGFVITTGYLITALLAIPFSVIEIVDWAQGILYTISLACILEMCFAFAVIARDQDGSQRGFHAAAAGVPAWNYNVGLVIEVSFLTWCLSFSIPMWLEQTAEGVSVNAALWWSCLSRGLLFIAFGLIASGAFPELTTMNVLDVLRTKSSVNPFTQVCGFLFAATSVFPNIIAHSMAVRRNLESTLGATQANWLGVGLPWAVAWLFYFGAEYNQLVNTCSIYLNGAIQFLLPGLLFLALGTAAGAHLCRVAGIRASMDAWREVTRAVVVGVVVLIVLAYALNALVSLGVYGPKHASDVAEHAASDYGLAAGPAVAPAPAKAPGEVVPATPVTGRRLSADDWGALPWV